MFKKIINRLRTKTAYICEKCGWQTQKTIMTEKLKCHCKDCGY